jgi:hypothetical protein
MEAVVPVVMLLVVAAVAVAAIMAVVAAAVVGSVAAMWQGFPWWLLNSSRVKQRHCASASEAAVGPAWS